MNVGFIGICVLALILLYVIIWVFIKPFKKIMVIFFESIIGAFFIYGFNILFSKFGFCIGLNFMSSLVCGILGIPGFVMLAVGSFIL